MVSVKIVPRKLETISTPSISSTKEIDECNGKCFLASFYLKRQVSSFLAARFRQCEFISLWWQLWLRPRLPCPVLLASSFICSEVICILCVQPWGDMLSG